MLFSALLMIFILLPLVGLIISNAYEKHMIAGINNELSAYSYSILAIVEVENNELIMPDELLETQFNVSQSGLYAVISAQSSPVLSQALWSSQSFIAVWQAQEFKQPSLGQSEFYQVDIESSHHFVYSLSVSYGSENSPYPITLHIIKQQDDLANMMAEFHHKLFLGLAGLLLVLLLFQYLWSVWTLKPLKNLQIELKNVEQGESERLNGAYPTELTQVTEQLNLLLNAEQKQRRRYRNALSDLAHSLKTPLAVIQSQAQLSQLTLEQLGIINNMVEHQLRKAQSAGQSSWYLGTKIAPVVDKLILSLEKIYQEKALAFTINVSSELVFKGDEADLLEILGNLLDNACKAAVSEVSLSIVEHSNIVEHGNIDKYNRIESNEESKNIRFIIEDDGCGIEPLLRNDILQRGTRADTYQHGHGIGLAIVRDLVDSYQGNIFIESSTSLNGAKFILVFPL